MWRADKSKPCVWSWQECFFAGITGKRIRCRVFKSVEKLKTVVHDYLAKHYASPELFVWTKKADAILLQKRHSQSCYNPGPSVSNGSASFSRMVAVTLM